MAVTVTIDSTLRDFMAGSLELVEQINGRSSLVVKVYSADGTYTPDFDDQIDVHVDTTLVFRGLIVGLETSHPTFGPSAIHRIEASDFSFFAERLLLDESTEGGITGRDAADYIVDNYLNPSFGVTRDPAMQPGGTLGAVDFDFVKISEVFDKILSLVAVEGWLWRIDENRVLKAFLPSIAEWPCPFTITDVAPNIVGDITIRRVRDEYANRVFFVYNDGTETPAAEVAENGPEIIAHGNYAAVFRSQNQLDEATAQSIVDALVAKTSRMPTEITVRTMEPGAHAGQTLTVNLTARGLDADYLIQDLRMWDQDGKNVFYEIKAVEGASHKRTWIDTYKLWAERNTIVAANQIGGGGSGSTPTLCASPSVVYTENFAGGTSLIDTETAGGGAPVYDRDNDGTDPIYPEIARADYIGISGGRAVVRTTDADWYACGILVSPLTLDGARGYLGARYFPNASVVADPATEAPLAQLFDSTLAYSYVSAIYNGDGTILMGWRESAAVTTLGTPTTSAFSYAFTADAQYDVNLYWRCGTIAGSSVASDGFVRLVINDAIVFERSGIPVFFHDNGVEDTNEVTGAAWGFYGLLGPITNMVVTTCAD